MAVVSIPNWLAAFRSHTLTFPEVVSMVGNRVAVARYRTFGGSDPKGWKMPTNGVVFREVPGPMLHQFQAPIRSQQLQIELYGANELSADQLYRIFYPSFLPQDMTQPHGFVVQSLGASILSIQEMVSPYFEYEIQTAFPRVIAQWFVTISELPTNVVYASASIGSSSGM